MGEMGIWKEITGPARYRQLRYEPYVGLFDDEAEGGQ